MRRAFSFAMLSLALTSSSRALADDATLAPLLTRLAEKSALFEAMFKKASFTLTGHMEDLDGDGAISARKDGVAKIKNDGTSPPKVEIVRYAEDGVDKTDEARKKSEERAKERKPRKPDEEVHMPFLQSEQAKYAFRLGEADARDPARVRVYFDAKKPAENAFNGSAWVDTRTGDVLTMGVAPSKTGAFVDYLRVTLEFGASTPQGAAISKLTFEGGGGFLFFHKRFRGTLLLTDYETR